MDHSNLSTPHLTIVLHAALTSYLSTIHANQASREAGLPRQGKDIETAEGFEERREAEERVAAAQILLDWEEQIVRNVENWVIGREEADLGRAGHDSNQGEATIGEGLLNRTVSVRQIEVEEEEPYVDILTGKWIFPKTANTAGPSNCPLTPTTDGYEEIRTPSTNPEDPDDAVPSLVGDEGNLIDLDCFTSKAEQISKEMKAYFQRFMAPTLPSSKSRTRSRSRSQSTSMKNDTLSSSPALPAPVPTQKTRSQSQSPSFQNVKSSSRRPSDVAKASPAVQPSSLPINTSSARRGSSSSRPPRKLLPPSTRPNTTSPQRRSSSSKARSRSQSSSKPTTTSLSLQTSSPPTMASKPTDVMSVSADELTAQKLQAEWDRENDVLQSQRQFALDLENKRRSPLSQFHLDRLEAQRLQAQLEEEDARNGLGRFRDRVDIEDGTVEEQARYAREHAARLEREMVLARRLAAEWQDEDNLSQQNVTRMQRQWEEQDRSLVQQEDFAKSLDRDMAAAEAAQIQWERELREQEVQARKVTAVERRREEDTRRAAAAEIAEAERRARLEKERAARKEAERNMRLETSRLQRQEVERKARQDRARKANEEAARRIQQESQRKDKQRAADAKRARDLVEREKKAKQAECASCMEAGEKANMCLLPCKHAYCGECTSGKSSPPVILRLYRTNSLRCISKCSVLKIAFQMLQAEHLRQTCHPLARRYLYRFIRTLDS